MSPAKEAAFMAYLDKFTAFVRSDLSDHGEIAIALETEYNISPLKTDVRYAELMTRAVARLRQGVSGLPGVQLKIGVGYLMQRLLDFGVSEFRAALNTSLTWAPLADFFAPSWSHDNAGAYVDNDGTTRKVYVFCFKGFIRHIEFYGLRSSTIRQVGKGSVRIVDSECVQLVPDHGRYN